VDGPFAGSAGLYQFSRCFHSTHVLDPYTFCARIGRAGKQEADSQGYSIGGLPDGEN